MLGYFQLEFYIPGAFSLKEKRFVLKSIKDRVQHKFNVSVAEIDGFDKWQRSLLGIAMVANEVQIIENSFNKILRILDTDTRVEIINQQIEYYN